MQKTGMEGSNPGLTTGYAEKPEHGSTGLGRITESAQQTMDRLTHAASVAADRLSARSQELLALQGRALDTARTYAKGHPLATIGIVIVVGVLLSRLMSRK